MRSRGQHGDGFDRLGLDVRQRGRALLATEVEAGGLQVLHDRRRAAIGNMHEVRAHRAVEQDRAGVRSRADTRRAVGERRFRFRI
jgi:hypothetical protein